MTIEFFVPGVPIAKQYKQDKNGVIHMTRSANAWEKNVGWCAKVAAGPGFVPAIAPVFLYFRFDFPLAKTRKELAPYMKHLQDPDTTNLIKSTEDGLKRVLFADDNMVWCVIARKQWVTAGQEGAFIRVVISG